MALYVDVLILRMLLDSLVLQLKVSLNSFITVSSESRHKSLQSIQIIMPPIRYYNRKFSQKQSIDK